MLFREHAEGGEMCDFLLAAGSVILHERMESPSLSLHETIPNDPETRAQDESAHKYF